MSDSLRDRLEAVFKDISCEEDVDGRLTLHANPASVLPVLGFVKDDGYDYLVLVSCVDWIDEGALEVVYVLSRYPDPEGTDGGRVPMLLKVRVPRESPVLASSIEIFPVAEPHEREIHELFGIRFDGHPRLTPLLLEREYEVPPFRKDFDTRQYVEEVFGNVPPVGEKSQEL